ncbi:gamma-butyrobetaine hydroxylase-like domain-containing protein [Xanthobacter sp. TB0136]|uniref:gamma-butyrobetaine hydroxylase-like domain-containing protein n=1 Tax=Xanthobacter sp. TB0136 TaxID=3459177 RepID=UPI00403A1F58
MEKTRPATSWPTEIRLLEDRSALRISFEDGAGFTLSAELLRVESPSAEVQGHARHEKKLVSGKRHVTISAVEPVGNYAIRILFSDGHDTGIYPWPTLYRYGQEQERMMADYVKALEEKGLSRG